MKKYLIFDRQAITRLISSANFQSIETQEGRSLINHVCMNEKSEAVGSIVIKYLPEGVIFTVKDSEQDKKINLLCFDLTTCNILSEKDSPDDLLTVIQKTFRLSVKIWDRKPFSQSERFYETKSILFPFILGDRRRLVIERSSHFDKLKRSGVEQPLLAYKYSAEDPANMNENVSQTVLKLAINDYIKYRSTLEQRKEMVSQDEKDDAVKPIKHVETSQYVGKEGFQWLGYDGQYRELTEAQKNIVDFDDISHPLRIEGPAGTGKTIAMLMRAYKILCQKREKGEECHMIFFSHNESTRKRNLDLFALYEEAHFYLSRENEQSILFINLLEFCREVSDINRNKLLNLTPENVKEDQLLWIMDALETSKASIKTFRPLLSQSMRAFFDQTKTPVNVACKILQHEFSVQIKGRTDALFENYRKIKPIKNGLPYENEKDQELIFLLFTKYQKAIDELGVFDADDVVMEALSRLNAPVWRRERRQEGYDLIFVDEMHLFNLNEQSVFHFLSKAYIGGPESRDGDVPICFALDYTQAIGDRGDTKNDYLVKSFKNATLRNLDTVFRNSLPILNFCESIVASGTLMFQEEFKNPYTLKQNAHQGASRIDKAEVPKLFMYEYEEAMIQSLKKHIDQIMKSTQYKPSDIAVVDFDNKHLTVEYIEKIQKIANRTFTKIISGEKTKDTKSIVIASPYDINGLEFEAVIIVSVDGGHVPQKYGISDISKHFLLYSSYNLLYLAASRARKHLILLGSSVNGISICLEHAIDNKTLIFVDNKR